MGREFSKKDMDIFNKMAPEAGGSNISQMGHPYPFILRPISHKFAESAADFRERLERLTPDDLNYLVDLALQDKEEIRSLDSEDIDSIMELVAEKVSSERVKELKLHLEMV